MACICNMVLIVLEIVGLTRRSGRFSWKKFIYYTQLSNAIALASSVLYLLLRGCGVAVYVRYLAVCMLLMTAFVTVCILVPMGGGCKKMLLSGNG